MTPSAAWLATRATCCHEARPHTGGAREHVTCFKLTLSGAKQTFILPSCGCHLWWTLWNLLRQTAKTSGLLTLGVDCKATQWFLCHVIRCNGTGGRLACVTLNSTCCRSPKQTVELKITSPVGGIQFYFVSVVSCKLFALRSLNNPNKCVCFVFQVWISETVQMSTQPTRWKCSPSWVIKWRLTTTRQSSRWNKFWLLVSLIAPTLYHNEGNMNHKLLKDFSFPQDVQAFYRFYICAVINNNLVYVHSFLKSHKADYTTVFTQGRFNCKAHFKNEAIQSAAQNMQSI